MGDSAEENWEDVSYLPVGLLGFISNIGCAEASAFCSDLDLDVLEICIGGLDFLVFYSLPEYMACVYFCLYANIEVLKFCSGQ